MVKTPEKGPDINVAPSTVKKTDAYQQHINANSNLIFGLFNAAIHANHVAEKKLKGFIISDKIYGKKSENQAKLDKTRKP